MNKEERLTDECWRNLDAWECCGQDRYCNRGCDEEGGCINGCIVPKLYTKLAKYEDVGYSPEEILHLEKGYKKLLSIVKGMNSGKRDGVFIIPNK